MFSGSGEVASGGAEERAMRAGWMTCEESVGSHREVLARAPLELISAGNPLVPECRFLICYFTELTSM